MTSCLTVPTIASDGADENSGAGGNGVKVKGQIGLRGRDTLEAGIERKMLKAKLLKVRMNELID